MTALQTIKPEADITTFLSVIERAAIDPKVDVLKMEKMLDMQERILNKQAEMSFNQAMTRLQPKLPTIAHKSQIAFKGTVQSTYAKYEDIDEVIRPLYTAEGFSLSFNTEVSDGGAIVIGTLSHEAGHSRTASIPLPLDSSGSKNNIQAMGSTISYGKRYLVGMLLNIVTKGEDDNGQASDVLSIEDAAKIDLRIVEVKADKKKFLDFMGVDDVRKIRMKDFGKALNALASKEAENQKAKK